MRGTRRFPVQGPEEREGVRGTRRFPVQGQEEPEGVRGTRHFPMQGPEERERGARHAALPCGARGAERTSL